jgi:signal transduction histidine kinase
LRRVPRKTVAQSQALELRRAGRALVISRWIAIPWALAEILTRTVPPYPPGHRGAAVAVVGILAVGNAVFWAATRRPQSLARERVVAVAGLAFDVLVLFTFVWLHTFAHTAALWVVLLILPLEGANLFGLGGALATWAVGTVLYIGREVWGSGTYSYILSWNSIGFRMGVGLVIALVAGLMARQLVRQRDRIVSVAEQLAEAQAITHIGSWEVDLTSEEANWSDELYRISGFEPAAFPASNEAYLRMIHPDDRAAVVEAAAGAVAEMGSFSLRCRIVRSDEQIRVIEVRGRVMPTPQGELRLIGTAQDVTERHEAEVAFRQYARELAEANERLKAADNLKDHIIAATNHELRTPLTTILGCSVMLNQNWDSMEDAHKREFVGMIEHQSTRLHSLVEDLLTLAGAGAGALKFERRPLDVTAVIAEAIAAHGVAADVAVRCPENLRAVGDYARLVQILTNYLSNARKYGSPPVEIRAEEVDGWVEIRVADQGPGVPHGFVERLFEKFSQAQPGKSPGSGLGLSIVRELATGQGAEAWYEPSPGGGACFGVRVPRTSEHAGEAPGAFSVRTGRGSRAAQSA